MLCQKEIYNHKIINQNQSDLQFLGPRGPLRTPSSARPFVRPSRQKSRSPLQPNKSSQDHRQPINHIFSNNTCYPQTPSDDNDTYKDKYNDKDRRVPRKMG